MHAKQCMPTVGGYQTVLFVLFDKLRFVDPSYVGETHCIPKSQMMRWHCLRWYYTCYLLFTHMIAFTFHMRKHVGHVLVM